MEKKIKVMIADDMEAQRRRLERSIAKEPDIDLIKSVSSGHGAVINAEIYKPDIILMDIEMEDKIAGITAAQEINKKLPAIKIIILTVHEDDNIVFAAFQAGIVDYLVKTEDSSKIISAVRKANMNQSPIRPIIAAKIRDEFKKCKDREESFLYLIKLISTLTPSEFEVLKLLYAGYPKKEIAQLRCVEYETIKKQVNYILKKCQQPTTNRLVQQVKEMGVFEVMLNNNDTFVKF